MKKSVLFGLALFAGAAFAAVEGFSVSRVSAQPRWPWDAAVDVEFFLDVSEALTAPEIGAQVGVSAIVDGETHPLSGVTGADVFGPGWHSVKWDPSVDFPGRDLKDVSFRVEVTNAPFAYSYLRVDLDTGEHRHFDAAYADKVNGDWLNKTRYMVFKYVPSTLSSTWTTAHDGADSFTMGAGDESEYFQTEADRAREAPASVRLTKAFWLGVYPVTVGQLSRLTGGEETNSTQAVGGTTYSAWRGADAPGGAYCWPTSREVDPDSYVGRLRTKTGLAFDLPTEAQWEYACRAGTATPHYCASTLSAIEKTASRTATVGTKTPNPWGFYDLVGCRHQWTLTLGRSKDNDNGDSACLHEPGDDPVGQTPTYSSPRRVTRGSHCWANGDTLVRVSRSAYRFPQSGDNPAEKDNCGARLCLTMSHP